MRDSRVIFNCLAACGLLLLDPATTLRAAEPAGPAVQTNTQLPAYPQPFDIQGPITRAFGFAVTQPGEVVVDVQSAGAPVVAVLQGAAAQPIVQQSTGGPLRLTYNVTAQDVQKSVVWSVQLRLANPTERRGRASGTINIQYPPVDQSAVQRVVQAAGQRSLPTIQEQSQAAAPARAQALAAFQQQQAQYEQQQLDRRKALNSQLQPQIDQLRSRADGQVRSRGLRGDAVAIAQPLDLPTTQRTPGTIVPAEPATSSSSQAIQSAGTTPGPQSIMPNPAIASLSVAQGQPNDPVMINGSGFGTGGGEVHFVVAPGRDLVATVGVIWNDSQIFATVPDVAGVLGFSGTVYVKRGTDKLNSNLVPFRFNPLSELRLITRIADASLQQINGVGAANYGDIVGRAHGNLFWGPYGNDNIYQNTRLKNGWLVNQKPVVYMPTAYATSGAAYLVDSHVGTNWPHMNVGFWIRNGVWEIQHYAISIVIQGPKGVPDGVVVP